MNDVNFTFYQDQVTALIGPNGAFEGFPQTSRPTHLSFLLGAGKSTLLNLITGLFSPTPGDCTIDGASIKHDTQRARQSIGICPQNDGLYGILTVRENIEFFLRVKGAGYTENEVKQRIKSSSKPTKLDSLNHFTRLRSRFRMATNASCHLR